MFITLTEKEVKVAISEFLARKFSGYSISSKNDYLLSASGLEYELRSPDDVPMKLEAVPALLDEDIPL